MTLHAFGGYGLELEYMIVDRHTLDVRPFASRMLDRLDAVVSPFPAQWDPKLGIHVT